jgi:molybdenum cofactor guanylyltransferase
VKVDVFILIGGRSRRMGRDKATLEFAGETLVERTAATVGRAFPSSRITLVAADAGQAHETFPAIFDVYKDRGPFGAIHAALATAQTEWVLILACDLPFVSDSLLLHLSSFVMGDVDAIVPLQEDGKPQPLCAFYRVEPCLEQVGQILAEDQSTPPAKAITALVRTHFVAFDQLCELPDAETFFINVNTPDDYRRAKASVLSVSGGLK